MNYSIIIAAVLSIVVTAQTETSSLRVEEVFSVETSEELEVSLTSGYPMQWLAEILEDETIPEEDRYWLDCRVRAVIAIDLHTFFDRNGNPVTYDVDWIMPGEHYWRETFVLSPLGDQIVSHSVESGGNLRGEVGQLRNRFGENIGETALTARGFRGSRDGSVWASSLCRVEGDYRLVLLYSDGSHFVSPIEMSSGRCGVSQSGNYVILASRGKRNVWNREPIPPKAILVNKTGEIIWETELEMIPIGNPGPVISPDDKYCAIVTQASTLEDRLNLLLQVFDMETGLEIWRIENPTGTRISFSPDSKTLFLPGNISEARCFTSSNGNQIWTDQRVSSNALTYADLRELNGSNNADFLSAVVSPEERTAEFFLALFDNAGQVLAVDHVDGDMSISPNGNFTITENYRLGSNLNASPILIRRIMRGGE